MLSFAISFVLEIKLAVAPVSVQPAVLLPDVLVL